MECYIMPASYSTVADFMEQKIKLSNKSYAVIKNTQKSLILS